MAMKVKAKSKAKAKVSAVVRRLSTLTKFNRLPKTEQRRIACVIVGGMRKMGYFGRGGYKSVHGPDQANREWTSAEHGPETMQLTASERNRLIALARNAERNSDKLEGIIHQLEINVIGVEGGKAVFNFPDEYKDEAETIRTAFAKWARSAEYFEDVNLQKLLKLVLRTLLIGGDCVLVFDWDVTPGSTGQIISFEPDCIGNLNEADFKKHFPNCHQYQGIIKNEAGKTVGVVCSWSERGQTEYKLTDSDGRRAAWTMIKPAGVAWEDCQFTIVRTLARFNQMRGMSRLWSGLGTVVDLSDLQGYEVQTAKKNSQTIAQVLQTAEENEDELAAEMDPDAEAPIEDGAAEISPEQAAAEAEEEAEQIPLDLDEIRGAGCIYDVLPPGVKMELLDTKHPNNNLIEFSKWLHGGVAFAVGLGNVHASGKADSSYSAAMAELLISSVEFRDEFHELEIGVLDWALSNWSRKAQADGLIPSDDDLPEDWRHACVTWQQPPERTIDPVKEQSALKSGLQNGTILYRDKLGPDWKNKVRAFAEEVKFFKDHGLTHPSEVTVSGAIVEEMNNKRNADNGEKEEE